MDGVIITIIEKNLNFSTTIESRLLRRTFFESAPAEGQTRATNRLRYLPPTEALINPDLMAGATDVTFTWTSTDE